MRLLRSALGVYVAAGLACTAAPAHAKLYVLSAEVVWVADDDESAAFRICGTDMEFRTTAMYWANVGDFYELDVYTHRLPWPVAVSERLTACPPGAGAPPGLILGAVDPPTSPEKPSGSSAEEPSQLAADLPAKAFNTVAWFACTVDGFAAGRLSVTIDAVSGVPRALRQSLEAAVDGQDAVVLAGPTARVYDRRGRRVPRERLGSADEVSVKGKLLRPSAWTKDEDGAPIPTIRAKRVTIKR